MQLMKHSGLEINSRNFSKIRYFCLQSIINYEGWNFNSGNYLFHLIPKMKEPLRGIRFRTVPFFFLSFVSIANNFTLLCVVTKGFAGLCNFWEGGVDRINQSL